MGSLTYRDGVTSTQLRYGDEAWSETVGASGGSQRGPSHRIVHAYFDLDWQILWNAEMEDIPQLREQVSRILESEFPDSQSG